VKVLAAEPGGGGAFGPAILADSAANSYVGPIATHDYGTTSVGTYARPAPPANNTHPIWETECTPKDTGPITIATMVYAAFTTGGVNAWHYSFFVAGTAWPASVTPYVTTTTSKLAAGTPITLTAARFTASLDAQSVTTFVGKP